MPAPLTVTLQLEEFVFGGLEIPERISVGGKQMLVVHTMIGGTRVIDALGRDDKPLEWSGLFLGSLAVSRARYLDGLRIAGKAVTLTWGEYSYQVIVEDFVADFDAPYRIPYRIVCQVEADNTTAQGQTFGTPVDDAVNADLQTALNLAQFNQGLVTALTQVQTAIGLITTLATAPKSLINSVLNPLVAAQTIAATIQGTNDSILDSALGFAGIVAGADPEDSIAGLQAQQIAMANVSACFQIGALCGRMTKNLTAIGASETVLNVAGGNLFAIAAEQYGDATEWTTLAKANGLTSPFLDGAQSLAVPSALDDQDGVLNS